jgi:trehalose 6-phosphate phosphatase
VEAWASEQAARTGLVAHSGRKSVELLPPVRADKGRVVAALAEGLGRVCYLGDDRADLPAFRALAALTASGVETLAVAVDSDEMPPELRNAADVVVDGPRGAHELLAALAGDGAPADVVRTR